MESKRTLIPSSTNVQKFYNGFLEHLMIDHVRINPRHTKVQHSLRKIIKQGDLVLDLGCGTGISTRFIAEQGAKVIGVDISPDLIGYAQVNSAHPNAEYHCADITDINFNGDDFYNVIVLSDVFEHIRPSQTKDLMRVLEIHSNKETVIYMDIPDARFQRFMKKSHPDKLQIIDEIYPIELILTLFNKIGFSPTMIELYGLDVPYQYNQYIFIHNSKFEDYSDGF